MVPGRQNHHFNPHEREARDARQDGLYLETIILIHTSVKLVTTATYFNLDAKLILIHTSVKLVTVPPILSAVTADILIHTSVKLVTFNKPLHNMLVVILIHTSVKLVTDLARQNLRAVLF